MIDQEKLDAVVRHVLSMDSDEDTSNVPTYVFEFMRKLLKSCPEDTNFVLEAAEPGDDSKGGDGYGLITCTEDDCFDDIILDADPERPDGGKSIGLGSIKKYKEHCRGQDHIKARDKRVNKKKRDKRKMERTDSKGPRLSMAQMERAVSQGELKWRDTGVPSSPDDLHVLNDKGKSDGWFDDDMTPISLSSDEPTTTTNHKRPREDGPLGNATAPVTISSSEDDKPRPVTPRKIRQSPLPSLRSPVKTMSPSGKAALRRQQEAAAKTAGDDDIMEVDASQFKPSQSSEKLRLELEAKRQELRRLQAKKQAIESKFASKPKASTSKWAQEVADSNVKSEVKPQTSSFFGKSTTAKPTTSARQSSTTSAAIPDEKTSLPDIHQTIQIAPATAIQRFERELHYLETRKKNLQKASQRVSFRDRIEHCRARLNEAKMDLRLKRSSFNCSLPGFSLRQTQPMLKNIWPEAPDTRDGAIKQSSHIVKTVKPTPPPPAPPVAARPATQTQPVASSSGTRFAVTGTNPTVHDQQPGAAPRVPGSYGSLGTGYDVPHPSMDDWSIPGMIDRYSAYGGGGEYYSDEDEMRNDNRLLPYGSGMDPPLWRFGLGANLQARTENPGLDLPLRDDQMAKFFEEALNEFAEMTTVAEGAASLGLASVDAILPTLKVTLMPHQILGVAWMLSRERNDKYKGGILADSMGLGKTIQTIATMAENPSTDPQRKTTLVIAPVALLTQWEDEINKFVKNKWKIHLYHGKGNKVPISYLQTCDVVIASYGQLINSLPPEQKGQAAKKNHAYGEATDSEDDDPIEAASKRIGPLLKMKWFRVCLDEAAVIRNRKTRGAKAAYMLQSVYRWVLSGTLVVNTLADLFSPFYFLGVSDLAIWDNFRDKVVRLEKRRPGLAAKRVQAVLQYLCLRRTASYKVEGREILQLPPKIITRRTEVFNEDEQTIYDTIEKRAIARFNRYLRTNTVLKNYANVLTMILRLRQICNSVSLVVRKPGEMGHPDDLLISNTDLIFNPNATASSDWNRQTEIDRAKTTGGEELVNKLIIRYQQRQADLDKADQLEQQGNESGMDGLDLECGICYEAYGDDERVTSCCHSFCATCIEGIIKPGGGGEGSDYRAMMAVCPMCREPLFPRNVFIAAAFKPAEEPTVEAKAEEDVKVANKELDLKVDIDFDQKLPPSTKMIKSLEIIQQWQKEAPKDKILIFSQFVAMIDLLSNYLERNGVSTTCYTGSMSKDDRDDCLADFRKPEGAKVCIISTKAGGVGLNLTCANKVLILDHTWTYAATAQAIDRAWRIGQTKQVDVVELCIANTIEGRILELQQKKKDLADGAFGEGEGVGRRQRLTLNDLRRLFERDDDPAD